MIWIYINLDVIYIWIYHTIIHGFIQYLTLNSTQSFLDKKIEGWNNGIMKEPKRINKSMTMEEIVKANPRARETLAYFHIGGCESCAYDPKDTLEIVAEKNAAPADLLVKIINELH